MSLKCASSSGVCVSGLGLLVLGYVLLCRLLFLLCVTSDGDHPNSSYTYNQSTAT